MPGHPHLGYSDLIPLMSVMTGDEKHAITASSTLDVIWTLYDRVLSVDPDDPTNRDRDRFLLSKGHGPMAFYAVLAAKGFLDPGELDGFGDFDSRLGHHPDRTLIPGVEISSGSLGHGLPIAVGMALGVRLADAGGRVFCLIGDGELGEGSNHEAIAVAARFGLDRLTVVVIDNASPYLGWPGGIGSRFEVEGWESRQVDGRDLDAIEEALAAPHPGRPMAVVADSGANHD
ncbi:MAG: thiamine pyrophosphate-dependent enzyme [Actinomycetota bacterium]|nr:thiamine pyrophosphate-dependent enzyme [Actinomycetota bacterium]